MRFDLLLRNGQIASSKGLVQADVGIRGSTIDSVGDLSEDGAEVEMDISGLTILPGVIDTHVHFREPGAEYKEDLESGTRSAIAGGVTTIFEMPNTNPTTTDENALEDKLRRAEERAWANYAFWVGATPDNIEELAHLECLPGAAGIKVFMGASTGSLLVPDDETLRRVLRSGKRRVSVHAEDHYRLQERKALLSEEPNPEEHPMWRDAECARLATERLLGLSAETGRPVHILHVTTAEEIPLIHGARRSGVDVTSEVTPHHLWFASPEAYERLGTKVQMNPPIRSEEHRSALRTALDGGFFQTVGSDHAPHTLEEKAFPYPQSPSGMPGVQTLLSVMLTLALERKICSLSRIIEVLCEGPADLFGIQGKGFILPGYDADLAIVDLERSALVEPDWIQSKCGWSPYEGDSLRGWPVHTVVGGQIAMRDGEIVGGPSGRPVVFANSK